MSGPFAWYDLQYRHDLSPMLDYLACVVDHCEAHARGGSVEESNLVTACDKCNMRKGDRAYVEHMQRFPRRRVNTRYGPPQFWDGLSSLFVTLAADFVDELTARERAWLKVLNAFFAAAGRLPNRALQQPASSVRRS